MPRFISVIYSALTENASEDQRALVDSLLKWPIDAESWGEGADAEAGISAMMDLGGR